MSEWTPDAMALMKRQFLHELSKRDVTIPRLWRSVDVYEALVSDGTAKPILNVSQLMRGYTITAEGMKMLAEFTEPPLIP